MQQPGHVLIVDPDATVLETAVRVVREAGLLVSTASHISDAITRARSARPDVVLVAASLVTETLASVLRSAPGLETVPLVVTAELPRDEPMLTRAAQYFDEILRKPFHAMELVMRVRSLVRLEREQRGRQHDSAEFQKLSAELERLAVRDPLTGAYNRRYFERKLQEEVLRSTRYKQPLTLVLADVDHFKRINDTYGHVMGDFVLRSVVETFSRNVRNVDVLARYGGEEFAVLAPSTGRGGGLTLAERLRAALATGPVLASTGSGMHAAVPTTASFGVITLEGGGELMTGEALVEAADAALYRAKRNGRNRVESFDG